MLTTILRSDVAARILELTLALSLALALQACGRADDAATPKAAEPEQPSAPVEPAATPTPEPASEPTDDNAGAVPAAVDEASSIADGAQSYAIYCATCHGATGDADTPIAQALSPPPTRHDDGAYMRTLTDDYLFKVIKEGGAAVGKSPMMAPWGGSLSDEQIRAVVAFIRTLPKS